MSEAYLVYPFLNHPIFLHEIGRKETLDDFLKKLLSKAPRVAYTYENVDYKREYFASYPDSVMVIRLTASESGKLSLDVKPTSAQKGKITATDDSITISGQVANNGMVY